MSKIPHDHNIAQLPQVIREIELGISESSSNLKRLGRQRDTIHDQRRYLLRVSLDFTRLIKAAVEGDYAEEDFFGTSEMTESCNARLRAGVWQLLTEFAEEIATVGHAVTIVDDAKHASEKTTPRKVLRAEYMQQVKVMIKLSRGCELPGMFNSAVIGELFRKQAAPWKHLAEWRIEETLNLVGNVVQMALRDASNDEEVIKRISCGILEPIAAKLRESVRAKLDELLAPHMDGHPITYNHYLTENLQKAQAERYEEKLKEAFGKHVPAPGGPRLDTSKLLDSVRGATEPNMDNFAATLAVDAMEAYYKVAMKKFVDDFSVLAIEQCVMRKLSSVFPPDIVGGMTDEQIAALASESPDVSSKRIKLAEKLKTLEAGRDELESLVKRPEASGHSGDRNGRGNRVFDTMAHLYNGLWD